MLDLLAALHQGAAEAGRDPAEIGIEGRLAVRPEAAEEAAEQITAWREVGATHLSLNTMGHSLVGVDGHIAALASAAGAIFA